MGADFNRNSAARTVQRAKIATSIARCGDRSAEKADGQQCCTSAWHEDA
jgi:hypothetical protein